MPKDGDAQLSGGTGVDLVEIGWTPSDLPN